MRTYQLPYFGDVDIDHLQDYYSVCECIGGKEVKLDLNFVQATLSHQEVAIIKGFLEIIEDIDRRNREHYKTDFESAGITSEYINFYLDELFADELASLIDINQPASAQKLQLLNRLELQRVGLYPNQENGSDHFGTFDYSIKINGEYCNQLLVVNTKANGEIDHITWES